MSFLAQLRTSDLTSLDQGGPLWELYRHACVESPYFFTKAVWMMVPEDRNIVTWNCHGPLFELVKDRTIRRALVEYPRKHLKSSIITVARPVYQLVCDVVEGRDPNTRYAIYSSTITNSRRQWREIKNTFQTNNLFQFLFPELIPAFEEKGVWWNEDAGCVPRRYDPKDPTFDTLGGGKATSRHYDDICLDDLINEENFDSPSAVEKAIEYYQQSRNLLEDSTSRLFVVGNRWSMTDLNHYIHREEPDIPIVSVSCFGPQLEGTFRSRNLPESVQTLLEQMPQGEPIWPERFDREALGELLRELKPRIFSAQYLNNPADPGAVDFKMEWLKWFDLVLDDEQGICIEIEGGATLIPLSQCNIYITWDPALDGRTSESENAVVVSAMDAQGRVFVLNEYARKCDPLVALEDLLDMAAKYKGLLKATGVEEVLFQKVLGKLLADRAKARGIFLGLRKLKTPTGLRKDQRIRAWVGTLFEEGRVYVRRTCVRFVEQYSYFGVPSAKRDVIDAFAYGTQLWSRPVLQEDIDIQESVALSTDRGITGYGTALAG